MEVLIRWSCHCAPRGGLCAYCKARGYHERWVPFFLLRDITSRKYIIRGRRHVDLPSASLGITRVKQDPMIH
jgi:hypothetical protein